MVSIQARKKKKQYTTIVLFAQSSANEAMPASLSSSSSWKPPVWDRRDKCYDCKKCAAELILSAGRESQPSETKRGSALGWSRNGVSTGVESGFMAHSSYTKNTPWYCMCFCVDVCVCILYICMCVYVYAYVDAQLHEPMYVIMCIYLKFGVNYMHRFN